MKKEEKEFDQIAYQNEYNRNNYERLSIMVQKGKKEKIKERAKQKGMSVNKYINYLIENDNIE